MRNRSILFKICLALLSVIGAGCAGSAPPPVYKPQVSYRQDGRKIYFSMKDAMGDDNGPGHYQYPLRFDNRQGFFDIRDFEVSDAGAMVEFRISTRRPIQRFRPDGSSEAKGWFLQLIDIYIDKDHKPGSGITRALPGRFVEFTEDSAWDQMILVTPNRTFDVKRLIDGRTNDLDLVHLKPRIFIPDVVTIQAYEFVVQVPKATLGEPQPGWGYQCLMLPFDSRNLANGQFQNGKVYQFATDTNFGGGSNLIGNPNVIDLLAPSEVDQRRWLGGYHASPNPADNQLAEVRCLYADPAAARPALRVAAKRAGSGGRSAPVRVARPAARAVAASPLRRSSVAPVRKVAARRAVDSEEFGDEPGVMPAMRRLPEPYDSEDESAMPRGKTVEAAEEALPPQESGPAFEESAPERPARTAAIARPKSSAPPRSRSARYSPAAPRPTIKYRRESFSGDPDDLFLNAPRSR